MSERAFDKIAAGLTEAIETAGDAAAQRSAHVTRGGDEDERMFSRVPTIREWKNAQGQTVGAAEGVVKLRERVKELEEGLEKLRLMLRHAPARGKTLDEMRANGRADPLYQTGDLHLVWVNEGDLEMAAILIRALLAPPSPETDGKDAT